jgi:glc operon protein GlcG
MTNEKLQQVINRMLESISAQIPAYQTSPEDWSKCAGNVAVCIIDDAGNIYGKIWGDEKLRGRGYYDVAFRKASQVWITGYKTNEFERLIFADKLNYKDFGIELPDLIGWEGGQPIQLDATTRICCGFSGFKGTSDLAIVRKAADEAMNDISF